MVGYVHSRPEPEGCRQREGIQGHHRMEADQEAVPGTLYQALPLRPEEPQGTRCPGNGLRLTR